MTTSNPSRAAETARAARYCFAQTVALLLLGMAPVPVPVDWAWASTVLDCMRSTEPNRADRENSTPGYYEGLIGRGEGPQGPLNEMAIRVLHKPTDWARFSAADVTRPLPDGDFLQFELKANVQKQLFGHAFTTNAHGMRDRELPVEKPEGVFRVAVLGSSIDMGWGIPAEETYVRRLEDWLNEEAARLGSSRRFEVMNFAVAAYGPLQKLESFRRKAAEFRPDLVLYSANMLDTRLMEIHLCDLFRAHADLRYDFLRKALAEAGVTAADLATGVEDKLLHKDTLKRKLRPQYWPIYDAALGELAAECRSRGVPLACLIVPRVGKADAPGPRAESVAWLRAIASHHALPLYDLAGTFDGQDPSLFELASWDDHPNALGHRRLFQALSRSLTEDPALAATLFPGRPSEGPGGATDQARRETR
ncbi:MAG: SGNH/GDSL hydrolase family protein [Isosphaeraceae bacterium]